VTAAWEAAGLSRITLHECRHTYASMLMAGRVIRTEHGDVRLSPASYADLVSDAVRSG
jgi:integrase